MSTSLSTSPDLPVPPPTRTEVLGMLRLLLVGSATWAALLCVYFTLGQWSFNHMVPALAWGVVGTFPVLLTARWMSGQYHALSPQCRKFVIISGAIPFNLIAFLGHAKAMGNLNELESKIPHNMVNKEQFRGLLEQSGLIAQVQASKIVFCVLAVLFLASVLITVLWRGNARVRNNALILTVLTVAGFVGFIGWLQASTAFMVELFQAAG